MGSKVRLIKEEAAGMRIALGAGIKMGLNIGKL